MCLGYQSYYLIYYLKKYNNITADRADFFMLCSQKTNIKPDQSDGEGFVFSIPGSFDKYTHLQEAIKLYHMASVLLCFVREKTDSAIQVSCHYSQL